MTLLLRPEPLTYTPKPFMQDSPYG